MQPNTALIVEPRFLERLPGIIENFRGILTATSWEFIFYCGRGLKEKWTPLLHPSIIIRELPVTNFENSDEYSDFFKQSSLWESLRGEWVLTFQADTWLISTPPYTIDFFIQKNKSFIGGNMSYYWPEMSRYMNPPAYRNFNGGLSLRKREHMLEIIDAIPPKPTVKYTDKVECDPEDVYFTMGCYLLGFPVGDDEESAHFAVSSVYYDKFFGIHKPGKKIREELLKIYPEIVNSYLPSGDDPAVILRKPA